MSFGVVDLFFLGGEGLLGSPLLVFMGGTVPGVFARVCRLCVRGFVTRTLGLVGSLVVVTGGAPPATLCVGLPPSVVVWSPSVLGVVSTL